MRAFVTVHDGRVIDDCDVRFAGLNPTYLFVGSRQPPDRSDVIHCAAHPGNVEHLFQFYDFTGWHVLADLIRRGVVRDSRLLLLQYDMSLTERPATVVRKATAALSESAGPVAFEAGGRIDWWSPVDQSFEALYRSAVDVDVDELPVDHWPTTQGMAWRSADFVEFMGWFAPLFDVFAPHPLAGHLAERTITAWCHARGKPATILRGPIVHEQRDSHGTTALFYGRRSVWRRKAALFGR